VAWVSESYLAAERLINWFYYSIDEIATNPVFAELPNCHPSKWTKVHNHCWLAVHCLDMREMQKNFMLRGRNSWNVKRVHHQKKDQKVEG